MKKIYADNGSTSFPKAPLVSDAMKNFLDGGGFNINRGSYESAYSVQSDVFMVRKLLCDLFNCPDPRLVVFTPGITYSLNMVLKGFLKEGDHVITTSMEHNAVLRPLHDLAGLGVTHSKAPGTLDGTLDPNAVKALITPATKAVVMTHASNVCGTIFPIEDIYEICKEAKIKLIIDSAQTAGILPIDFEKADCITFTAHKGLLAAQGLGGFLIKEDFAEQIEPQITGGTGSKSTSSAHPHLLPDKFEAGTMNLPAIIGLKAALEYIMKIGIQNIHAKEMERTKQFIEGVHKISGVNIAGKQGIDGRIAVISLDFENWDNAEVAAILDRDFGIMTRASMHCAPDAHHTLGTYPGGTVRFSFGHLTTADEIDKILSVIKEISEYGL
ncbi:MAG: aminotransferase class V-fold PLP-dependent enzyme [Defluviitaleaceae bacterium]|nr:aminotransferase class V-fold PLP-dependent enzyme [Defluviitaleaceae bacterium]